MKINFKQPRYILPLIILPFLFILFFVFGGGGSKGSKVKNTADSLAANGQKGLNPDMPGVSGDIARDSIKDKFSAYRQAFQNQDGGETAMQSGLTDPDRPEGQVLQGANYSPMELRRIKNQKTLDSLQRALQYGSADIDRQMRGMDLSWHTANMEGPGKRNNALPGRTSFTAYPSATGGNSQDGSPEYDRQMKLFRDQMRLVDSLQNKADNGTQKTGTSNKNGSSGALYDPEKLDPGKNNPEKPMHLSLAANGMTAFNTLRHFTEDKGVAAMIDQDIKATLGSRVRVRLLQDIFVGGNLIAGGTYLYGFVTGFQTQRVNISISQVMQGNRPLPVKLDLFDNDGYLGLYVPGSNFREFTKEIGSQGTQGLSQVNTSDGSSVTTGLMQSLFNTTSTTLSKLVRKDKALLKYNYTVYLKENTY